MLTLHYLLEKKFLKKKTERKKRIFLLFEYDNKICWEIFSLIYEEGRNISLFSKLN